MASRYRAYRASIEDLALHIDGARIDCIKELSPVVNKRQFLHPLYNWLPRDKSASSLYPFTNEILSVVLAKTLVADIAYDDDMRPTRGNAMNWHFHIPRENRLNGEQKKACNEFNAALWQATLGRRLAVTEKGYIGLVPAAAKIGDIVAALYGGEVLYVLRQKPDGGKIENSEDCELSSKLCKSSDRDLLLAEFIGECYIHGLMDSNSIMTHENGGLNTCSKIL